jgi:enediyne polyketide synthase
VEAVAIDPQKDLYEDLLFQEGRFRRLHRYRLLRACACEAELRPAEPATWFGPYLPSELLLGDPGARDAAIHSIQACIPHARILPIGIERLYPGYLPANAKLVVRARERERDRDTFVYDMEILGPDGGLLERWEGLRLRAVEERRQTKPWAVPLLAPYLERRLQELLPGSRIRVALEMEKDGGRRSPSDPVIRDAIGGDVAIARRPDGKPEAAGALHVSAAHAGNLVLAVADPRPIGCDMEPVESRSPSVWRDLLGAERGGLAEVVAQESGEDLDAAATRIWAVAECLKKVGAPVKTPLVYSSAGSGGWVVLSSGSRAAATYLASVRGREERLVLAVLSEQDAGTRDRSPARRSDESV